jgi:hypothetical protein
MKKKIALALGVMAVLGVSLMGGEAMAHGPRDHHRGWGNNNHYQRNWSPRNYGQFRSARANWFRNNHRVAYRPGNGWGNNRYYQAPRRSWW